jgi:hypothetical protein
LAPQTSQPEDARERAERASSKAIAAPPLLLNTERCVRGRDLGSAQPVQRPRTHLTQWVQTQLMASTRGAPGGIREPASLACAAKRSLAANPRPSGSKKNPNPRKIHNLRSSDRHMAAYSCISRHLGRH